MSGDVLACFFFAYALGQLPAGWFADRFGPRKMLVTYILLWSACTALTGFATGLAALVVVRVRLRSRRGRRVPGKRTSDHALVPIRPAWQSQQRGVFGGRIGNSLALWLTAGAIAVLGSWRPVLWIYGAIGVFLAFATWLVFSDDPASHPWIRTK